MKKLTHEERTKHVEEFFQCCIQLQKTKGKDYTTNGDAFKDLQDEADAMGITPEKVLWIAMNKHYKAVRNYCRLGQTQSEPIETRLMDLANYISLMWVLINLRKK
jgi:predicted patatin/cPLA2 family phospholipase